MESLQMKFYPNITSVNEMHLSFRPNFTVFVSGIFDLFDVMCKQYHRAALNPFLTGIKMVVLTARVYEPLMCRMILINIDAYPAYKYRK